MCGAFYLCFYCVLSCLSCLLLHPVLLCFLSSVCMLNVYGCFGEINYDDDDDKEMVHKTDNKQGRTWSEAGMITRLEAASVVISRPWSRDSSALEFILFRSRSWS